MSAFHVHHLHGCAPVPLAFYLKALGVLRIVAEQKDPGALGWWQDEHFCLLTTLDREAFESFLLEEYAPTPFVSPWNKGSGFFTQDDKGLSPLEESTAPRFARFRAGIVAARTQLMGLASADEAVRAIKDRTKAKKGMNAAQKKTANELKQAPALKAELAAAERAFKTLKADLFGPALRSWRGPHRAWMDTAVVVVEDGEAKFPSLLGTGGNDRRLDFTNNAMQRIGELFDISDPLAPPREGAKELLSNALWSTNSHRLSTGAVGQFLPGSAGGANMTTGPEGSSSINPWDFVLMLEGTVCLSARSTKRLDPRSVRDASAPFAVRSQGVGVATHGGEKSERGEQWMPIWSRPSGFRDLLAMLGEARMQLGRQAAYRPIDVVRAIAGMGVARGLTGFVRYGYLERNGQSNIAVPLGRLEVRERPLSRLVDEIASWLDRLRRVARDKPTPARFKQAEHRLSDAVFAVLTHDRSADRWQEVLVAAAAVESIQARGTGIAAGPIPPISTDWLAAAGDHSPEWRLACALGSATGYVGPRRRSEDPVRAHCLPLEQDGRRFRVSQNRLADDPRLVVMGRDAVTDCLALVERRLVESEQRGQRYLPLVAASGFGAQAADLARLTAGRVDLQRVFDLGRALMAVRWDQWHPTHEARFDGEKPEEAWVALRLAVLPWALSPDRAIFVDSAIVRRLRSGDGAGALEIALRRLRATGLRSPVHAAAPSADCARLWGAGLAFPISWRVARTFAKSFEMAERQETR